MDGLNSTILGYIDPGTDAIGNEMRGKSEHQVLDVLLTQPMHWQSTPKL
jgi:hypothetical protein